MPKGSPRPSWSGLWTYLAVVSLGGALASAALAADAVHGEQVFKARCALCHSVQPGREMLGPSLFGIVGRHSCADTHFHYSPAACAADLVWTEATLDKYITSPKSLVPGTQMAFPGLSDPAMRADILAYLATLK